VDKNGQAVDSPSPFAAASLEADKTAFTAFMRHLKKADPQRTVIMVQVENEAGNLGYASRLLSGCAETFRHRLCRARCSAPCMGRDARLPTGRKLLVPKPRFASTPGRWRNTSGRSPPRGRPFIRCRLYANAALRDPLKPGAPGSYESGGPTDNVLAIWKVAAPAFDILAPDIYRTIPPLSEGAGALSSRRQSSVRARNRRRRERARFFFSALGLQAIGFSPFGMDYTQKARQAGPGSRQPDEFLAWAMNYRLIGPMQREIARLNFEGKLKAVAEEPGKVVTDTLPFGDWNAVVSYGARRDGPAVGNPSQRLGAPWWPSSKTISFW
jgi:hypothetical protein